MRRYYSSSYLIYVVQVTVGKDGYDRIQEVRPGVVESLPSRFGVDRDWRGRLARHGFRLKAPTRLVVTECGICSGFITHVKLPPHESALPQLVIASTALDCVQSGHRTKGNSSTDLNQDELLPRKPEGFSCPRASFSMTSRL